jgi:cysteine desulfurase / selenocysteine lyase
VRRGGDLSVTLTLWRLKIYTHTTATSIEYFRYTFGIHIGWPKESKMAPFHYLDHASMGRPAPRTIRRVREALAGLDSFQSTGTAETLIQFEAVERARHRVAQAIHADPKNVLLVANTSHAMGTIFSALPFRRGDQILVADVEFMGAPIVLRGVCSRVGVEIVPVPTRNGRLDPSDFERSLNSNVRLVIVSSVQEISGFRANIQAIREIAAKYDAFVVVDGIQEAGTRPIDFATMGVDAYCAGGHKWLRSPFGLGFACFSERLLSALQPTFQGYLAMVEPEIGWSAYMEMPDRTPFDPLRERDDAGRLEMGGYPNWLGAVALDSAVEEWLKTGPARTWSRILKLRTRLTKTLKELGIRILSTEDSPEHEFAGIVTFCLPGGITEEKRLVAEFERNQIFVSLRYVTGIGGIRTGIHVTNSPGDIDALLEVTRRFIRKGQKTKSSRSSTR